MKKEKIGYDFLIGGLLLTLIWWGASVALGIKALPSPWTIYGALPELLKKGLMNHVGASMVRLGKGLGIALAIGCPIGMMMGRYSWINRLLSPFVYLTYPVPKTALLPIIMILGGMGEGSKITLVVLITVFPILIAIRDAVLVVDESLEHVLISLGANKLQRLIYVVVPAILPSLLTQIRLSVGTTLSILFFAENYGTSYGLGYYIQDCWGRMNYIGMYGGIVTLGLVGFGLFMLVDGVEKLICKG